MNDWDFDNLMFLLNATPEEYDEWLAQASQDDIDYALSLIKQRRRELLDRQAAEWEHYPETDDFTEANEVLKKFRL
jgi:hypothetical protein